VIRGAIVRQGIEVTIKSKIIEHGRGWCFTAIDFEELGSRPLPQKTKSHSGKTGSELRALRPRHIDD
jgi:hypothetical protein